LTPVSPGPDNHWFAIYRSEDENLDVTSDEIVDVHFGNAAYAFVDTFAGTQDFAGAYTYFATTLDRFWNESNTSNSVQSDPIPSFAPTIIATSPAAGDSISVSGAVVIRFSKTMDANTFMNAVTFSPEINVSELRWSDGNKTLTIHTEEPFDFATSYTVTIQATATDINGKPLDGDGDGVEGDPFQFQFKSFGQDVVGPRVIFSFPDFETSEQDFALEEVITVVVDEILDTNSVTDNRITLKLADVEIPIDYLLTRAGDRSVLSIQPTEQQLEPDQQYDLILSPQISDTLGNELGESFVVTFNTTTVQNTEINLMEPFLSVTNWFQPSGSGSTAGIVVSNTRFEMSSDAFLPALPASQRISPVLRYEWDESASRHLIRLFLSGGSPRNVQFDTTYVLQCYVFGDGSNNKFRFALDDSTQDQAAFHEVSEWITVNWLGWRLLEWELSDPNSVGIWIGDGILNGPSLRFDSFQLTHEPGDATTGRVFFDNLRLVKKSTLPVQVADGPEVVPLDFALHQNFPNPFNPTTTISFDIPNRGRVRLKVYDALGREVDTVLDELRQPGKHNVQFDAKGLASGVYFYRLVLEGRSISKRMLLVK
jgi:hypothetical protein